jgi:hypothetical protein
MKNKLVRFISILAAVMLPVFLLQYFFSTAHSGLYLQSSLIEGHLLNYILTVASFAILCVFEKKKNTHLGFAFMGFSVLKMFTVIVFLFPMFQDESLKSIDYVLQFFSIYFFYLILELWFVFKLLIKK